MWIWFTNVQTRCTWKSWLTNLSNFWATDTLYASFHWNTAFTFAPGFVAYSIIHTICGYILDAGQINYRIPPISNWNFWFSWFKRAWLQDEFFEVSYSFDSKGQTKAEICWITVCRIQWSENWTWFYCLSLHDVIKFSNLMIQKIRLMADMSKYSQNFR